MAVWTNPFRRLVRWMGMSSVAEDSFRYKAFISYKHAVLPTFTSEFERALKTYGKPLFARPLRVFRDEAHLTPGIDLPKLIAEALDDSEFLILLASPAAAASDWVALELERWCGHLARADNLIIVLVDGDIAVDSTNRTIDWTTTTALPGSLARYLSSVPLYVDVRRLATGTPTLRDPEFKKAINAIAARLHMLDPNDMLGQEILEHRRTLRLRNGVMGALAALVLALGAAFYVARGQTILAIDRQREATARALAASAALTFGEAPRFSERAVLLALESLTLEPRNAPAVSFLAQHLPLLSKPLWSYRPQSNHVDLVAWAPDGRSLAVAPKERASDHYGPIEILEVSTGARSPFSPGERDREQSERLDGALFSPDSKTLYWYGLKGLVAYQPALKRYRWTMSDAVIDMTHSRDGHTLAVTVYGDGDAGGECLLMNADDGVVGKRIKGECSHNVWKSVFAAVSNRTLDVRAWPDGRLLARRTLASTGRRLLFDASERWLAVAGDDPDCIDVLRAPDWRPVLSLKRGSRINDLAWAGQSTTLVVALEDGVVEGIDVRTGVVSSVFRHANSVGQAAVSPDGEYVATASLDGTGRVFHLPSGPEMRRILTWMRQSQTPLATSCEPLDGATAVDCCPSVRGEREWTFMCSTRIVRSAGSPRRKGSGRRN